MHRFILLFVLAALWAAPASAQVIDLPPPTTNFARCAVAHNGPASIAVAYNGWLPVRFGEGAHQDVVDAVAGQCGELISTGSWSAFDSDIFSFIEAGYDFVCNASRGSDDFGSSIIVYAASDLDAIRLAYATCYGLAQRGSNVNFR